MSVHSHLPVRLVVIRCVAFFCTLSYSLFLVASCSSQIVSLAQAEDEVNAERVELTSDTEIIDEHQFFPPANEGFANSTAAFQSYASNNPGTGIGSDFFGLNDNFDQGLLIKNENVAMKIGGFLKVDLIQDFNPISNTDAFDVTTIEIGALPRTNTRFHARQTRLNWDTRWNSEKGPMRVFVEGDFFFNQRESSELGENRFRLRHAYAQHGRWIIGQTWTTLSDVAANPPTLDFEGQVASINTRRTILRWTTDIFDSDWRLSLAAEDPFTIIETPDSLDGEARTETPDAVVRLRWSRPNIQFQVAGVVRELGFQPVGLPVIEETTWGVNCSQVTKLNSKTKFYNEILWGTGIGSFRGIADAAPTTTGNVELIDSVGWMVGTTYEWSKKLSSNLTYAENGVANSNLLPDELKRGTYMAVNLIYDYAENTNVGIEYLYGERQNIDGQKAIANRIQIAFTYFLP